MPAPVYFKQTEHPVKQGDAARQTYRNPSPDQVELFNRINRFDKPDEYVYPGTSILIPSMTGISEQSVPLLCSAADEMKFQNRNSKLAPAPWTFNQNFSNFLYAHTDTGAEVIGEFFDFRNQYLDLVLDDIKGDLDRLNKSYMRTQLAVRGNVFPSDAPRSSAYGGERAAIYQRLQKSMGKIPKGFGLLPSGAHSPEDALNIKHNDVKRTFRVNGKGAQIKKIKSAIEEVSETSKKMNVRGDRFGVALSVASGVKDIYEYRKTLKAAERNNPENADVIGIYHGSRAIGATAGGYIATVGAVLLLGTPVGWGGLVVVGGIALAAGIAGSMGGEKLAGEASKAWMESVDSTRDVDKIVEAPLP